jgi:hypothetical protein
MEQRFWKAFSQKYIQSTYFDQRRRWRIASASQREAALAAGFTAQGLWSAFASAVPLKK